MNPYWGKDIWGFIGLFFSRLVQWGKEPLASDEIQVLVLVAIGIASTFVGIFLVLKKITMMANALSHTILLGIILSYLLLRPFIGASTFFFHPGVLLLASLITAWMTVTLVQLCQKVFRLQEDASVGLVFTFLFALGVLLVSLYSHHLHLGVEAIMGNMDALHVDDVKFAFGVLFGNLFMMVFLFPRYKLLAFDPTFMGAIQGNTSLFSYLLLLQTALTAVGAFRAIGVFLFLIFLTAPILSAKVFTKKLKSLMAVACGISVLCGFLSVALSRHILSVYDIALSTAGLTCVVTALSYPVSLSLWKMRIFLLKSLQRSKTFEEKQGAS
ncbi:MAG: metal ABC transporter permease [Chlamydiae bacterium]|nr:metal ABC transporter permease [Chlamydiota bacterium]